MPTAARKQDAPRIARLGSLGPQNHLDHQDSMGISAADPDTVLTVPGYLVPLVALDLPTGLRGQAREQVAHRQLADRSAIPETDLALRPFLPRPLSRSLPKRSGQKNLGGDSWTRVLMAETRWLQGLEGLNCRAVLPDYLSLGTAPGLWTVTLDTLPPDTVAPEHPEQGPDAAVDMAGDTIVDTANVTEAATSCSQLIVRLGPEDGFSALPQIGLAMLTQALHASQNQSRPAPKAILWLGPTEAAELTQIRSLAAQCDLPLVTNPEALDTLGLPRPSVFTHGELSCDLRHNPLAARARLARQVLPWRWPLLAACLAAALWGAAQILAFGQVQAEVDASRARSAALVKAHFVPEGPVLDARLQVSRALADLRRTATKSAQDQGPLDLMQRLAEVLSRADLRPDLLSYQTGIGLVLALRVEDFSQADHLAAALRDAGLALTVTDSRVSDAASGVRAEFVITDAAPDLSTETAIGTGVQK
ncbi:type II secretion system protein L [Phaeobacter sp. CECT 5382]|uniref:type II secretion system protein GspL n=1 Tax=Phaeobacter sp. CECT 5382 TaxID=1712645 RepID=UPI0006D951E2|nr:type II secretion system protein GspL [Phaeobacter sp. CECT 5382]CUH89344.1 type II secretion system protein L [Phaeobacter sp. CECT 5382]